MAYTSENLIWQSYEIEVRYDPGPYNLSLRHEKAMTHVEIDIFETKKPSYLFITERD